MKFCDCGNLLRATITPTDAYHECMVCKKRHEFTEGDTLIRGPAVKPTGFDKHEHIIRHMHMVNAFPYIEKPCPGCHHKFVKYAILDSVTWYKCPECATLFQ